MKKIFGIFCGMIIWATAMQAQSVYILQRGETLADVATKYGTTVDALIKANPAAKNMTYVGMKLNIPAGGAVQQPVSQQPVQVQQPVQQQVVQQPVQQAQPVQTAPVQKTTQPAVATSSAACNLSLTTAKKGEVAVRSGDPKILRQSSFHACVEIDYSHANCEGKPINQYLNSRGADNVKDWPKECEEVKTRFAVLLYGKVRKSGATVIAAPIPTVNTHCIRVHVVDLDFGSIAGKFVPTLNMKSGGASASAVIEVINLSTGVADCVFEVNEIKGMSDYTEQKRREQVVMNVAMKMAKLAK